MRPPGESLGRRRPFCDLQPQRRRSFRTLQPKPRVSKISSAWRLGRNKCSDPKANEDTQRALRACKEAWSVSALATSPKGVFERRIQVFQINAVLMVFWISKVQFASRGVANETCRTFFCSLFLRQVLILLTRLENEFGRFGG